MLPKIYFVFGARQRIKRHNVDWKCKNLIFRHVGMLFRMSKRNWKTPRVLRGVFQCNSMCCRKIRGDSSATGCVAVKYGAILCLTEAILCFYLIFRCTINIPLNLPSKRGFYCFLWRKVGMDVFLNQKWYNIKRPEISREKMIRAAN